MVGLQEVADAILIHNSVNVLQGSRWKNDDVFTVISYDMLLTKNNEAQGIPCTIRDLSWGRREKYNIVLCKGLVVVDRSLDLTETY
jgi:hypothetical protein